MAASALDVLPEGIGQLRAVFVEDAARSAFHFLYQPVQVVSRTRQRDHADGGRVPRDGLIQFRHRDVVALAQLVFERSHYLAAVLQRLRVLDADFEGKLGDRHDFETECRHSVRPWGAVSVVFFEGRFRVSCQNAPGSRRPGRLPHQSANCASWLAAGLGVSTLTTTMARTATASAGKMASRLARTSGTWCLTHGRSQPRVTTVPAAMAATAPHAVTRLE